MSFVYKINQILNLLEKRRNHRINKWAFIYGVPRSGTTFVFHKFQKHARAGVSDWEVSRLKDLCEYYAGQSHINFNLSQLQTDILKNMITNGQPGGGWKYDLILKQINANKPELNFLTEMIGCEPAFKLFIFREPVQWYASAQKKFGMEESDLINIYKGSLDSFQSIGGEVVEYKDIPNHAGLKTQVGNITDFAPRNYTAECPDVLKKMYQGFKEKQGLAE